MSGLPTSLTVLRPIGFGTMRGPDGASVTVLPNAPATDGEDAAAAASAGGPAALLASPSTTNGQALRSPSALGASPPITPTHRTAAPSPAHSRPARDERQMRMAQAARRAPPPRSSGASLDDVGAIEIDEGHSDEETGRAEQSPLGLVMPAVHGGSVAGPAGSSLSPASLSLHPASEHSEPVDASHQHDLSRQHSRDPLGGPGHGGGSEHDYEHEQALALELGNAASFPTPASQTRSVLLDESSLPVSTVPPSARQKILSFDELRHKSRYKVAGLQLLAAATFIMGVASIVVGATSLESSFLYPTYPAATIVAGSLMTLFGPLCAWSSRRFKLRELRFCFLVSFSLAILQLTLGILSASRRSDEMVNEVRIRWSTGGYSASFTERWGSAAAASDAAVSHRNDMTVVQLLSLGVLVALGVLGARVTHVIQTHLSLVALATASKSESTSKATRRAREVAAYKDAMARDPELARTVELERIPAPLKAAKKAKEAAAKKYATASGGSVVAVEGNAGGSAAGGDAAATPHTRSRHLSGKDKDGKKEKDRAAKEKERAERHRRKKEKRDAEKARAARSGQAGVEVPVILHGPPDEPDGTGFSDHEEHKV